MQKPIHMLLAIRWVSSSLQCHPAFSDPDSYMRHLLGMLKLTLAMADQWGPARAGGLCWRFLTALMWTRPTSLPWQPVLPLL